jgi:hypothetical protein
LYDSTNKIVDTAFTYTDVDILRPSEKSPFDVILDNRGQVDQASSYKLSVSSESSSPKPSLLKLTVGDNYYDSLGYAHILGEVTNQGSEITQYAKVSGTFYNDQNRVVGTGFTFTDPTDLQPGQSAPFDLLLTEHAPSDKFGKMSSGSLNIQSQQYAMILPEVTFIMDGERDEGYSIVNSGSGNSNDDNNDGSDGSGRNCDPSYPDVCISPKPPDLNCPDISFRNFKVVGSDPHGFDGDNDGIGCDENGSGINDNDEDISDQEDDELPSCQDDSRPRPGSCRDDLDTNEDPIEEEEGEDEGNEDEGNEDEGNEDEGNEDEGNEDEGNEDENVDFGPDGPVD